MDFKFFQKFNLSGRIIQGLANCKAYLGITFMRMIFLIYFKVFHPVSPKGFQQYIAYLIRIGDFEKVGLSYLYSIYHIRDSISQGHPTIHSKLRAFHFLHWLYLYFWFFFVQRTFNNQSTIRQENFPPFPITPNIMLLLSLWCQKLCLKSSN